MRITEDNVVEQIKNKNEKAIRFLIREYGGLLSAIIRQYLARDHQAMEECMDDVLLSIWNHIESFDPEKSTFRQWAAAIAKFKAIDYLRRLAARDRRQLPVEEVDDAMLRSEHSKNEPDVNDLLEPLPEAERRIFEQYYLEGVSAGEIAEQRRAKPSWVHNKLSRGRKKLRQYWLNNQEG